MSRACVRLTQVGYLWFRAFLVAVLVETYVAQGLHRRPLKACCPEHPSGVAVLSICRYSADGIPSRKLFSATEHFFMRPLQKNCKRSICSGILSPSCKQKVFNQSIAIIESRCDMACRIV